MDSPLAQLFSRTDLAGHVIVYDETRRWPAAEREAILRLGILRRIEDADYVTCDVCPDAHYADIILDIGPEPRIYCGEHGLMRVAPERLQQWEVDSEALARLLAPQLNLTPGMQVVTPGRIWLLGRRQVSGRTAEFFLVQGIAGPDSVELLRSAPRLAGSPAPIIVCPDQLPGHSEWRESGRALFRLTEWAHLKDGRLTIEFEAFADLYRQTSAAFEKPLTPTPVAQREGLIQKFCQDHGCRLKQVCTWAAVDRGDLNRWKSGNPLIPDGGDPAMRIERLLQLGQRSRP